MVKIRLTRVGARKRPFYRIVAIDERKARGGRPLQYLGTYEPGLSEAPLTIDTAGIEAWVAKGAQLSGTVASLVRKGPKAAAAGGAG